MNIETKKFINYKNLKEETRTGLNSLIIEEKQNQINYFISKHIKKGSDKLTYEKKPFIKYNNCIYFDIETVKIGEMIVDNDLLVQNLTEEEQKREYLKAKGLKSKLNTTTQNYLKQYTFLIPKTFNRIIKKIKEEENYYAKSGEEFIKYLDIREFDNYYTYTFYNVNSEECLEHLFNFLENTIANSRNTIKIVGFNSNKFDTLIFKSLEDKKGITLQLQNKDKSIELSFDNSNKRKIYFIDILQMSINFSCNKLKDLGKFVKLEKFENDIPMSKEEFILYNIRDCEIPYKFVELLNKKYKIFDSNFSRYARNYNHEYLFESLPNEIEYVKTASMINHFNIAGGRTEPYFCKAFNPRYIDVNSLYTSGRIVLDTVIPTIKGDSAKFQLNKIEKYEDFKTTIIEFENHIFETFLNGGFFNYVDLAKKYDEYFKNTFFIGKFKLLKIKEDIPFSIKENLKFMFPFNTKKNGKTMFSMVENQKYDIGYYMIMFLCFFEFDIIEMYSMDKGEDIFKPKLIELFEERKIEKEKENGGLQLLKKLLMNTSWGIFATKNGNNKKITNKEDIERLNTIDSKRLKEITFIERGNETFKVRKHGGMYFKEPINTFQKWANNSLPSLAKNIVDNGHFIMFSFMLNVIFDTENKYEIYYTDTDSFMCNDKFYDLMNENKFIGEELGLFSEEYEKDRIIEAKFLAPKTYALKLKSGKIVKVLKGVRDWKTIVTQQSLNSNFRTFEKVALNPYQEQKRFLYNNKFKNGLGFGISHELIAEYEEAVKWK